MSYGNYATFPEIVEMQHMAGSSKPLHPPDNQGAFCHQAWPGRDNWIEDKIGHN